MECVSEQGSGYHLKRQPRGVHAQARSIAASHPCVIYRSLLACQFLDRGVRGFPKARRKVVNLAVRDQFSPGPFRHLADQIDLRVPYDSLPKSRTPHWKVQSLYVWMLIIFASLFVTLDSNFQFRRKLRLQCCLQN